MRAPGLLQLKFDFVIEAALRKMGSGILIVSLALHALQGIALRMPEM